MSRLDLTQKISQELTGLLPEYIREEAPLFEQFLKAYFEYLDSEIIVIDTESELDFVGLEDGMGQVLYESATTAPSPDKDTSRIVSENSANNQTDFVSPITVGEYIYGETTGTLAEVLVKNNTVLYVKTITGRGFLNGETVQGRTSLQTFVVKSYKENTIRANNNLLSYADIDRTTSNLIEFYQKDFIPSLNFGDIQSNRLGLKNISDFYSQKGTSESVQYLLRLLFGNDSEIIYPNDTTLYLSQSDHSQRKRMSIEMIDDFVAPSPTDRITQYDTLGVIQAQSIIESIYFVKTKIYAIDINFVSSANFTVGATVSLLDRDGITEYKAKVLGVMVDVIDSGSSTYISDEQDPDVIICFEDDSAILLEETSYGSNYRINDKINFTGSKDENENQFNSAGTVIGLTRGPIEDIIISEPGSGFNSTLHIGIDVPVENSKNIVVSQVLDPSVQPGLRVLGTVVTNLRIVTVANDRLSFTVDKTLNLPIGSSIQIETPQLVVFDDSNTGGTGAVGFVGSVTDQIILENAPDVYGQYEFTAEAGQTIFSGKDNYGKRLVFNNNTVQVWVDQILRQPGEGPTQYVQQNDRITFNTGLSLGQTVDIYHEYNFLTFEDQSYIALENEFIFLDGTLDFVISSPIVNGTNTDFSNQIRQGDTIIDSSDNKYQVDQVVSGSVLQLTTDSVATATETNVRRVRESGAIRSVLLTDSGYGYQTTPKVYPGGYFYFESEDDTSIFQEDEIITGLTSNAQVSVLRVEPTKKRIIVRRESDQSGTFAYGEAIQGNIGLNPRIPTTFNVSTGTGAELYAYSSTIGGVKEVNLTDQGGYFTGDGTLDSSSTYNMMIKTPSSQLNRNVVITGRISGATGNIISYDSDRHVLYYTNLNGSFLENEVVDYNLVDTFRVLKSDPYNARGKLGTTAIVERTLLGDRGTVSSTGANIQDSYYYQTHSYVIKTAQSINIYRSIIKDLVHPAGHIFFGEVSIQNQITDTAIDIQFRPTIIIHGDPVLNVPNAFSNSMRTIEIFTRSTTLITEDNDNILLETGEQIAVSLDDQYNYVNDPLLTLRDANESRQYDVDPTTNGPVLPFEIVDGIEIGRGTEYYDSSMRKNHINLRIISTFATAATRSRLQERYSSVDSAIIEPITAKPYNTLTGDYQDGDYEIVPYGFDNVDHPDRIIDGAFTVLSLDQPIPLVDGDPVTNVPGPVNSTTYGGDGYFIREPRRPAHFGKVFALNAIDEEKLIFEDGDRICHEERRTRMRFEERINAEVAGDAGDYILLENDEDYLGLEINTTPRELDLVHFVTERSIPNTSALLYTEDLYTIVTEDGAYLLQEEGQLGGISSYVPFGTTVGKINRIIAQNTFLISYYIEHEDGDNISFEDGGKLVNEICVPEGLRITQLRDYGYNWYPSEFDEHYRKRTPVAYSAYVTSG